MCTVEVKCKDRTKSAFIPLSPGSYVVLSRKPKLTEELQNYCKYLRERQSKIPSPNLTIATPYMRPQMVDWLYRTCEYLGFSKKLLFQTLSIADLYTTRKSVDSEELGLIFITSLFISAKFDSNCIKLCDLQKLCYNKYSKNEIVNMERTLLESLNYQADHPTAFDFLSVLWEVGGYPKYRMGQINHPIVESSLQFLQIMTMDPFYTVNTPSSLAGSAFLFAREFCHFNNIWDNRYQKCLILKKEDIKAVAMDFVPRMQCCLSSGNTHFKVCMEFIQMIQNHKQKQEKVKYTQTKTTKTECFWDNFMISNFD